MRSVFFDHALRGETFQLLVSNRSFFAIEIVSFLTLDHYAIGC